ncbi:MAG TPA: flagellar filament capping protein FliD [Jatrophihabitans sp.]|nr:flagellar filament capping protein FliD [Jatrophihabitans sp.]
MSAFSISGLSSGIDTSSLISQLMTIAAQPQTALKTQLTNEQNDITDYKAINTKLTAFQTAADALKQASTWSATKATSSNPAVVASTTSSAIAGSSSTFDVLRLATAQISTLAVSGTVVANPPAGIDVTDATGTVHHLTLTDGSAQSVVTAVNNASLGIRAALVNTDSGQILQFTATATGTSGAFSISGLDNAPQTVVAAQNAQIAVGDPAAGGYTVSSSTNTFTNAIPGLTFSVGAVASGVTVSVSSDATAISGKVQALVSAANDVLAELANDTGKGAALEGNYQLNSITQAVLAAVSHGDANGNSFATAGVQLTSTGTLAFDANAFSSAYTADPTGTQATLASSLASSMSILASNTSTTTISPLINSGNSQVADLTKQISDWDTRLTAQQTALQQKYTAMEVALQKLQSTSSWLTSALSSMDSSNNSSSKSN